MWGGIAEITESWPDLGVALAISRYQKSRLDTPCVSWDVKKPTAARGGRSNGKDEAISINRSSRRQWLIVTLLFAIKNWIDTILSSVVTDLSVHNCLFHIGSVIEGRTVQDQDVCVFADFDAADTIL